MDSYNVHRGATGRYARMLITQVLADLYECGPGLADEATLTAAARDAVLTAGATIVGGCETHFVPHGLTIALILAELHVVLTTWPEHRLLMVDVLLCNPSMDGHQVIEKIRQSVCPNGVVRTHEVRRCVAADPLASRDRMAAR